MAEQSAFRPAGALGGTRPALKPIRGTGNGLGRKASALRARIESQRMAVYVVVFLLGMVALWSVLCVVSHRSPDADSIEELVWSSSFEWGYYKHPPVPTWLLYPLTLVFGKHIWLTFVAAQISSACALWFTWKLGCEFTSPRRAFIAMLMVSVTAYFSIRATTYNHNSAQLWSIVAATWMYYRALRYGRPRDWTWLGIICAMALLTKYSALIQFAAFFAFFLWRGYWRDRQARQGVLIALVPFAILIAPHVYWLFHHGFEPIAYADTSIVPTAAEHLRVGSELLGFLSTQLGRLSPMLVAWGLLYLWNRRYPNGQGPAPDTVSTPAAPYSRMLRDWDRSFLLIVGLAPTALTVVVTWILDTNLGSSWASTFFVLFGFYTYWWLGSDERANLRRTAIIVASIQILLATGYAAGRGPLAYYTGYKTDSTYPGTTLSHKLQAIWHSHVPDEPLTLVAANTWLGGNIAVHMRKSANVFVDADIRKSPWLKGRNLMRCGMLIAFGNGDHGPGPTDAVRRLYDAAPYKGTLQQRWSAPDSYLLEIHWAIIPPRADCHIGKKQ